MVELGETYMDRYTEWTGVAVSITTHLDSDQTVTLARMQDGALVSESFVAARLEEVHAPRAGFQAVH